MSTHKVVQEAGEHHLLPATGSMSPDDPRHGTIAGVNVHQRTGTPTCEPCRRAKMRYEKRRILAGGRTKVSAVGTRRRIQALRALGYSLRELAEDGGWNTGHAALKYPLVAETITADTARRVAEIYERLSMTPATGPRATRSRKLAVRNGWAPPLAWDDIDDPDAAPDFGTVVMDGRGRPDVFAARVENFDWLLDAGESQEHAAARVGIERMDNFKDSRRRFEERTTAA